jgi:hypothetical protein
MSEDRISMRYKVWAESTNAYLVSVEGSPRGFAGFVSAEWVAKSLIEATRILVNGHRGFLSIRMPSWLAREKGFV